MNNFDRKIREHARKVEIPEGYDERIEQILKTLPEEEEAESKKKKKMICRPQGRFVFVAAIALMLIITVAGMNEAKADAGVFQRFKITIMDILNIHQEDEELGVESMKEKIEGKSELRLELQESLVDEQGIYLLVKITAPVSVELDDTIGFDYFAFCEGDNYNPDQLIGGGTDCRMLEKNQETPNEAVYVVNLTADMNQYKDKNITVCFKDLTRDVNGDSPELLVGGMWSITFPARMTVKNKVTIKGNEKMEFPFINTTAYVNKIKLTPLGITLTADVSKVPFEDLGVSDTSITIRLKMIDGSEMSISSPEPEEKWIVESGSIEFDQKNGHSYQKCIYSFHEAVNVARVEGIYVQDLYVAVK